MPNSTEIVESWVVASLHLAAKVDRVATWAWDPNLFTTKQFNIYHKIECKNRQVLRQMHEYCTYVNKRKALLVKGEIIVLMISFIVLYAKGKTEKDEKAGMILCSLYISLFHRQWPASHGWFFLEEKLLIIFFYQPICIRFHLGQSKFYYN